MREVEAEVLAFVGAAARGFCVLIMALYLLV
jgi:hypothetical protein